MKSLKELRVKNRYTQRVLAEKLGITSTGYSYYENSKRKLLNPVIIEKLGEIYGKTKRQMINIADYTFDQKNGVEKNG